MILYALNIYIQRFTKKRTRESRAAGVRGTVITTLATTAARQQRYELASWLARPWLARLLSRLRVPATITNGLRRAYGAVLRDSAWEQCLRAGLDEGNSADGLQ